MTITNRLKLAACIIAAAFLFSILRRCGKPLPPVSSITLKNDEKTKVVIGKNKITTIRRDKDGKPVTDTKFVPKNVTVIEKNNGDVEVKIQKIGFEINPGLGGGMYGSNGAFLVDVRLGYWNRLGLHVGNAFELGSKIGGSRAEIIIDKLVNPYLGVGYRLPWDSLSNTSVISGYGLLDKVIILGIRLSF